MPEEEPVSHFELTSAEARAVIEDQRQVIKSLTYAFEELIHDMQRIPACAEELIAQTERALGHPLRRRKDA